MELPDDMKAYLAKLDSEKEYLCAAYLDETGLKPSEVKIIERRDFPTIQFYLQRKDWVGDVETPAINEARDKIATLEAKLKIARDVLEYISNDVIDSESAAKLALAEIERMG